VLNIGAPSPEYYIDTLIENSMIFYVDNDLGYEYNLFSMLGGTVDDFMPRGYFSGYNASLNPYFMYLVDAPKKSCGILSLISLLIFL